MTPADLKALTPGDVIQNSLSGLTYLVDRVVAGEPRAALVLGITRSITTAEDWRLVSKGQPCATTDEGQAPPLPPSAHVMALHQLWRDVPILERIRFLHEMLTPAERRALQGCDDD